MQVYLSLYDFLLVPGMEGLKEVAGTTESAKERTNNNNLMYIDINSSHPPSIKKQIPISINKRISKLLSNEEIFNKNIRT